MNYIKVKNGKEIDKIKINLQNNDKNKNTKRSKRGI